MARPAISNRNETLPIARGGWLDALRFIVAGLIILHHFQDSGPVALAEGLQGLPGVTVQPPQSNILFVDLDTARAAGVVDRLRAAGVLCTGLYRLRFVTHLDVSAADIQRALPILRATL